MTRHWKTIVKDTDGSDVSLYVTTTSDTIRRDLDAGESGSLILRMRREKRHEEFSDTTDHADLASGALSMFRDNSSFTSSDPTIHEVESVPHGLEGVYYGGNDKKGYWEYAVTVYSEKQ